MYTLHERDKPVHSCHQDAQLDQSSVRDREATRRQSLGYNIPEPQTQMNTQAQTQTHTQAQTQMHTEANESPRDQLEMEEGSIDLAKTSQTDKSFVYDNYIRSHGKMPSVQDKPSQTRVPEQDLNCAAQQNPAKKNLYNLDKIHYPTQFARQTRNLNRPQPKAALIFQCECASKSGTNDDWRRQFNAECRTQQQQTDFCCSSKSQPSIPSATAIASTGKRNSPEGSCEAIRSKSLPRIICVQEKSLPRPQQDTDNMHSNSDFYTVESQNKSQYMSCGTASCGSEFSNAKQDDATAFNTVESGTTRTQSMLSEGECTYKGDSSYYSAKCSSRRDDNSNDPRNSSLCSNSAMPNTISDVECQTNQMDRATGSFKTTESGTIRAYPMSCECDSIYDTTKFSAKCSAQSNEQTQLSECPDPESSAKSSSMPSKMSNETEKFLSASSDHAKNNLPCGRSVSGDNRLVENSCCCSVGLEPSIGTCAKSSSMPSKMSNETEKFLSASSDHAKNNLPCGRSVSGDNRLVENSCCCSVGLEPSIGTCTNMTTVPDIESGQYFDADRSHITSINSQPPSKIANEDKRNDDNVDLESSRAKTTAKENIATIFKNAQSENTTQTCQCDVESAEGKQAEKCQQEEEAKRIENAEMGLESPYESKDAKKGYFDADKCNITTSINSLEAKFTETQSTGLKCISELFQPAASNQQSRRYFDADCSDIITSIMSRSARHDRKCANISSHAASCCHKSSMDCTDKTSSRSQSVMANVTCLCSLAEKMKLGQARHRDLQGPPFTRIRDPVVPSSSGSQSTKLVFMNNSDGFFDCDSSSDTSIGGNTNKKKAQVVHTKNMSYGVPSTTNSKSESIHQESDRPMSSKKSRSRMLQQQSRSDDKTLPSDSQFSKSCITTSLRGGDEPNMSMQLEPVGVVMSCRNPSCIGEQHFKGRHIQENDRYPEIASEGTTKMYTCGDHDRAARRSLENQPQVFYSTQIQNHGSVEPQNDTTCCCHQSGEDFIDRSTLSETLMDTYRSCVSELGYDAALIMSCPSQQCGESESTSLNQLASYGTCASAKANSACISKERIVHILNMLSDSNEVNVDRTALMQELFRELNTMLRQMEEDENNSEVPISFEDCIAAVAAGRKPAKNLPKSNEKLTRMQCLDEMEKYMENCFPTKKNPFLQPKEIVVFERDPHFDPFRKPDTDVQSKNARSKNFASANTDCADSKTSSLNSTPSRSTDIKFLDCKSGDSNVLGDKSTDTKLSDSKSQLSKVTGCSCTKSSTAGKYYPLSISSGNTTVDSKLKHDSPVKDENEIEMPSDELDCAKFEHGSLSMLSSDKKSEPRTGDSKAGSISIPSPDDENMKKSKSCSGNEELTFIEGDESYEDKTTLDSEVKSPECDQQKDNATNQQNDDERGDPESTLDCEPRKPRKKKCLCPAKPGHGSLSMLSSGKKSEPRTGDSKTGSISIPSPEDENMKKSKSCSGNEELTFIEGDESYEDKTTLDSEVKSPECDQQKDNATNQQNDDETGDPESILDCEPRKPRTKKCLCPAKPGHGSLSMLSSEKKSEPRTGDSKTGSISIPSPEDENMKKSKSCTGNEELTCIEVDKAYEDKTTLDSEIKSPKFDQQKDDATNQQNDDETGDPESILDCEPRKPRTKKCLCPAKPGHGSLSMLSSEKKSEPRTGDSKTGSISIPSPEDENIKKSKSCSGNEEPTCIEVDEAYEDKTTLDSEVKSPECDQQKDDATNEQNYDETGDTESILDCEPRKPRTKKCLAPEDVKKESGESAEDSKLCSAQLNPDSGAMHKMVCDVPCDLDLGDNLNPLSERELLLCEYMIRRMCELCGDEQGEEEATNDMSTTGEPCVCCHCRALVCDNQCKTVTTTLDAIRYDPVAETKFFIDSIICDLHAMNHVMKKNKLISNTPKPSPSMGSGPGGSFPVTITAVSSLGCRALYVRWGVEDCTGVGGYEIYVDGHLTNRFYSARHESVVVANVDVSKRHEIVLRAQAVGYEFPGDEIDYQENGMIPAHPELLVGAVQPWTPSVYVYEP